MFFLPKRCPHCKSLLWPWKKRDHLWACRRKWMWMIAEGYMKEKTRETFTRPRKGKDR